MDGWMEKQSCLAKKCSLGVSKLNVLLEASAKIATSLASHTLHREDGSGHTATIELLPRQKLDVTNQICTLCRSHPLSWSTITSTRLVDVSILFNRCLIIVFLGDKSIVVA